MRQPVDFLVINASRFGGNAVRHEIIIHSRHIDGTAVSQMSALRKAHSHNGITGLEERKINRKVCLRPTVRLDVCMLCAENFLRAVSRYVFHNVDAGAAAVISLSGEAFGIFVCQN